MRRKAVLGWCAYDFANSAFTTLVVTFVYSAYFTAKIAPDTTTGTALWSRGVTLTAILVALLSPILGAVADRGGCRKLLTLFFTAVCIAGTAMLYFPKPGQTTIALLFFVTANVAYEMAGVFYNAFLPDLAPEGKIGRLSGYGWSLGYVGGLLAMVLALVAFVLPEEPWFGLTKVGDQNVRATNLLVAVWFAIFSLPFFIWLKEDRSRVVAKTGAVIGPAMRQLAATFREIRRYRQIVRFLLARLVYNDGLITVFFFGGIYAKGTFDFTTEKLIYFGILLNLTAAAGAFALGFVDDLLGGKRTIQISLVALGISTLGALLAPNETMFWIAGSLIGVFSGPNQAASRSLMGRLVPPDKETEFFGFFAFSGKATAFLGPLLFGLLTQLFDSQRAGMSVVLVMFLVGGLLLRRVDEKDALRHDK